MTSRDDKIAARLFELMIRVPALEPMPEPWHQYTKEAVAGLARMMAEDRAREAAAIKIQDAMERGGAGALRDMGFPCQHQTCEGICYLCGDGGL